MYCLFRIQFFQNNSQQFWIFLESTNFLPQISLRSEFPPPATENLKNLYPWLKVKGPNSVCRQQITCQKQQSTNVYKNLQNWYNLQKKVQFCPFLTVQSLFCYIYSQCTENCHISIFENKCLQLNSISLSGYWLIGLLGN